MSNAPRNGLRSVKTAKAVDDAIAAITAADGELAKSIALRDWTVKIVRDYDDGSFPCDDLFMCAVDGGGVSPSLAQTVMEKGIELARGPFVQAPPIQAAMPEPPPGFFDDGPIGQDAGGALRQERASRKAPAKRAKVFKLIDLEEAEASLTAEYLVKGFIPKKGMVFVWGPPKCGKSFWVFTLMMHVALGREYRGHKVTQTPVVYLALEGQEGYGRRREAFRKRHMKPDEKIVGFKFCGVPLDLIKEHQLLIADIEEQGVRPGAVVIDTLNRSLAGSENKDEDMSAYLQAADAIQHKFECVVIIIHHCGYDQTRPRGHSSQIGAADVQISIKKGDGNIIVSTVELAKDMAEGATVSSKLEVVDLGTDQDGDQMTSCAVMPAEDVVVEPVAPKGRGRATSHREFDDSFTEACINFGKVIRIRGDGPKVKAVDVAQVRDEFFRRHATSETDAKKRQAASKKAFDRALQDDKLSREYPRWVDGVNQWIWKLHDKPAPQPVQQPED